MSLGPLLMLLAMSSSSSATSAAPHRGQGPRWPTPRHPPPPRAKRPGKAPARPAAPAAPAAPPAPAQAPAPPLDAASHAPPLAEVPRTPTAPAPKSSPKFQAVSVLQVQQVLNKLGQKLKPDGLYGPKTVSAWRTTARARRLPDSIMRLGPKTVDVSASTFAQLKQTAKVTGYAVTGVPELYIP